MGSRSHTLTIGLREDSIRLDRKSTRLNSSHVAISYAVFCLKKNRMLAVPNRAGMMNVIFFRRHIARGAPVYTHSRKAFPGLHTPGFLHIALNLPVRLAFRKG